MNFKRTTLILAGLVAIACYAPLPAEPAKAGAAADADLPRPLDPEVLSPLLENPPFTRPINLADSLVLTGIAFVQGKPVATLTDKRTKQSYLVTEEPNPQGWKLAEADPRSEPRFSTVKIMVGPEIVTIRYGETQITPVSSAKYPADSEVIRHDESGKPYVRTSSYLSEKDRERYYKEWSREAHDKYRDITRMHREEMLNATPQERAAFAKKVFDSVDAEERARQKK